MPQKLSNPEHHPIRNTISTKKDSSVAMLAQENQGSSVKGAEYPKIFIKEPHPLECKIDDLVIDHANGLS